MGSFSSLSRAVAPAVACVLLAGSAALSVAQDATQAPPGPRPTIRIVYALLAPTGVEEPRAPRDKTPAAGTVVPLDPQVSRLDGPLDDVAGALEERYGEPFTIAGEAETELPYGAEQSLTGRAGRLDVRLTLVGADRTAATLRIRLLRGGAALADSTFAMPYGRRIAISTGRAGDTGFVVLGGGPVISAQQSEAEAGRRAITPPVKIRDVRPRYPTAALRTRVQGYVAIRCQVGADGVPRDLVVVRSMHDFDEAALDAVRQWRFAPARDASGQPVPFTMTVTVSFRLQERRRSPHD